MIESSKDHSETVAVHMVRYICICAIESVHGINRRGDLYIFGHLFCLMAGHLQAKSKRSAYDRPAIAATGTAITTGYVPCVKQCPLCLVHLTSLKTQQQLIAHVDVCLKKMHREL